jgi:hypothetical protein
MDQALLVNFWGNKLCIIVVHNTNGFVKATISINQRIYASVGLKKTV